MFRSFDGKVESVEQKRAIAGQTIGAFRVIIMAEDGKVYYASKNNSSHYEKVIGITLEKKKTDRFIFYKSLGTIENPKWSLNIGDNYFLSTNGNITNNAPSTGFIQKIGTAIDSKTLSIDIEDAINIE